AILVGVGGTNRSRYWDLATVRTRSEPREPIPFPLAFSPDRRTILTSEPDGRSVQLRDATTGRPVGPPLPHPRPLIVRGALTHPGQRHACSSDRRRVLTLDEDNTSWLWDTESGKAYVLKPLLEHQVHSATFAGAFSPDGKLAVTSNFHGR